MDLEDWKAHLSKAVLRIRLLYLDGWLLFHIKLQDQKNHLRNDADIKGSFAGRHDVHKQQT